MASVRLFLRTLQALSRRSHPFVVTGIAVTRILSVRSPRTILPVSTHTVSSSARLRRHKRLVIGPTRTVLTGGVGQRGARSTQPNMATFELPLDVPVP